MRVRLNTPRRLTSRAAVLPLVALAALTTFACNLDKLTQPAGTAQTLSATVVGDTTVAIGATTEPMQVTTPTGALDNTVAVIWKSDKPTIATVDSSTGIVTGVALGTAIISAKVIAPGVEASATSLTVRVKYAGIKITAVDSLIAIGQTKVIDVRGTNSAATAIAAVPFSAAMTVVSRDPTIFTVNTAGALVAVKNGSARVFVQFDGLQDSVVVKVRQVTRDLKYVNAIAGELPVGSLNKDRTIAVTASDSLGVAIAAPTVTWATSDATTLTIGAATGVARGLKLGTATITATSDGLAKTILARITQVPATLTKTATTDALSAVVNTAVALPPQVTVVDSGNTPIPSVAVTFAVASGGGTVTGSPTSDLNGKAAATTWTLGTTAGVNTVLASAGGASATFTATGTFGAPKKLGFIVQPTNAAINAAVAPAIQVGVLDSLGNVVTTGAASTSSITIALGSGIGTLSGGAGTLTIAAVAGVATFSTVSINAAGSFTLLASTTGLVSATSNSFGVYGAAAKVAFLTTSITGTAGQVIGAIRVAVEDAGGNVVTSDTRTITVSITPTTGAAGAVLSGTLGVAAVGGVATFSTLSINLAGTAAGSTAYKLNAVATSLTGATSNAFDIVAVGPPAKLGFSVQPTNAVAGASMTPNIQVAIQDVNGVTNTASTASVTLAIEANPGSGVLAGTVTQPAVAGVATFSGISINRVSAGYTLNATSTGLTRAVSAAFNITAGAAAKVGFIVPPANAVTGTVISPSIQVAIQDANSNTVTTSTASVTLAVATGPQGAVLGGTTTIAAVAGVATFSTITASPAASGYSLTASSPNITSATSPTFTITANATTAIKLGFLTQPTNVASNAAITPAIQVAVQDANGATVTSSAAAITLALGTNAGGATASGTLTVGATSGVATFTNVLVGLAGTGYTLVATAPAAGLTSATSTPFNATFGTASKLAFIVQPTSAVAGTAFTQDLQIAVEDAAGNIVTNATNVVTVNINNNPGSSQIRGTTSLAAVNGIATLPGVRLTKTGTGYTLFASSTALNGSTSLSFDITPAPASALSFKTQPAGVVAGAAQASPFIQVAVVDSLGNLITTATDQISLAANTTPTNGAMLGTTPVAALNGIATFPDIKFNVSGSYTLAATATNLATVTSNGFFISAGTAAALKWVANPASSGSVKGGTILGNSGIRLEVDIVDAFGNTIFSDNTTSVTMSIGVTGAGPGGGVLSGTVTRGAASGQVFFDDLVINSNGTGYKLSASSGTLTAATSSAFDIAAFGSASKWKFTQQPPVATTASTAFSPPVSASLVDQFGNVITSGSNSTLTASLGFASSTLSNVGLSGTLNVPAVAGVATFNGVSATGSQDALQLFVSGTFGGSSSSAFNLALFQNANGIYDGIVSGSNLYYIVRGTAANTGSVSKVDLGTGVPTVLANGLNFPVAITLDVGATNVLWLEDGNGAAGGTVLRRESVTGTLNSYVTSAAMSGGAGPLQVDNFSNVFFIANGGANRSIMRTTTSFGAGAAVSAWFTSGCANGSACAPVFSIVNGSQGTTMYYFNGGNQFFTTATNAVSPSTNAVITGLTSPPVSVSATASTLYWGTATSVFAQATTLGQLTTGAAKATNGTAITRVGFDGTSLFALDVGNAIRKYDANGLTVADLATGVAAATNLLALDGSSVFWADNTASNTKLRRTAH